MGEGKVSEDSSESGKIYTVEKGHVTQGQHSGTITELEKDKPELDYIGKKLTGTYFPDNKIKWGNGAVWRRLKDEDSKNSEEDVEGNGEGNENLKLLKTNQLNGMWIDEDDGKKSLEEIDEIYSIEKGYIKDGSDTVAVKISDTDEVEINPFKTQSWEGSYDGSFPDDKINWRNDKKWIRLKNGKIIQDLEQIKTKLQGPNDNDQTGLMRDLESELEKEKQKNEQLKNENTGKLEKMEQLKQDLQDEKDKNEELGQELERLRADQDLGKETDKNTIDELQRKNDKLQTEKNRLEEEKAGMLEKAITQDTLKDEYEKMRAKLNKLEPEKKSVDRELMEQKKLLDKELMKTKQQQEELDGLKEKLKQKEEEIKQINPELKKKKKKKKKTGQKKKKKKKKKKS